MKMYSISKWLSSVSFNQHDARPLFRQRRLGTMSDARSIASGAAMLLAAACFFVPSRAQAQNNAAVAYEAAASYSAWNSNFLATQNGQTFYSGPTISAGASNLGGYGEALDIAVAEDNYEATHTPASMQLVSTLMNSFGTLNSTNWSGDTWDDDLGWMVNSYLRAYQITGNTSYLSIAEENWNTAYNRGWDTVLGGGIYENMASKNDKECLSNDPFVWEGVGLYEATGNSAYLTDAENIYAWVRSHLFNATNSNNSVGAPGQLVQGEQVNGTLESGDNLYNSGSFLEAANALYQVTGNSEYYNDAVLDINHVIGNGSTMHNNAEDGGSQWAYWFVKGLSDFCTDNNQWSTYYPWLLANANAAWSERNSSNLTWNDWTNATNTTSNNSLEMSSGVAIWQLLNVPQQYQIVNENSNLGMNLINGLETVNAPISQWGLSAGENTNQQWALIPLSNGNYSIISSLTDEAGSISAASKNSLAPLVDYPYSATDTSQQFSLISEGNSWYEIKNVNSGLVLDDDGGGTTNGTQIIQYAANAGTNQNWKLQPVTSFGGEFEIQCVASNDVLDVASGSTTNGAAVIQYPYSGATNQLWTFTPDSMGYYQILNVNSAQDLNVDGNAYTPANIDQWPGGNETSDQWLPVLNANGTYSFFNLNSGLVLDDPGGSTTQGQQFDQYGWNGGTNQEFNLISR